MNRGVLTGDLGIARLRLRSDSRSSRCLPWLWISMRGSLTTRLVHPTSLLFFFFSTITSPTYPYYSSSSAHYPPPRPPHLTAPLLTLSQIQYPAAIMRLLHYPGIPRAERNERNPGIGVRLPLSPPIYLADRSGECASVRSLVSSAKRFQSGTRDKTR